MKDLIDKLRTDVTDYFIAARNPLDTRTRSPEGAIDPLLARRYAEALRARDVPGADQEHLGPKEHGLYAEQFVRERPFLGPVAMMGMIPGYTAAKEAGIYSGRSPPSLDEMAEGYRGMRRGIAANIGDVLSNMAGTPPVVAKPPVTPPLSQTMAPEQLARYLRR